MTPFIQRLIFVLFFVGQPALVRAMPPGKVRPVNYVVLLDLSDRLLAPDQARRDTALIRAVFARFEKGVKTRLIINSHDRFRVVIAPQRGIRYAPDQFMNALYLDMDAVPMAQKRTRLDALRADLPRQLARLYTLALAQRTKTADFAGCDLWQYANEQLPTDLCPACDNRLVVLTDGYFDFEHNAHGLVQGNRATDSRVLNRLRRDPNWRQTLTRPTEGLLPITKPLPGLSVYVAEILPKYDRLDEGDLLMTVWQKWLGEMRAQRSQCQLRGSLPKSIAALNAFLSQ